MAVSILTVTHGNLGHELLGTAESVLDAPLPLVCSSLAVTDTSNTDDLLSAARKLCAEIDQGDGVLVLTDIFGSTPSNICNQLNASGEVRVLAGLNLPMLIRTMNYPNLSLEKLAEKALSGAHDGIVDCSPKR